MKLNRPSATYETTRHAQLRMQQRGCRSKNAEPAMNQQRMRTIKIDFDIHQLIELERSSFEDTSNDALRRLLKLSGPGPMAEANGAVGTQGQDSPLPLPGVQKEVTAPVSRSPRHGELRLRSRVIRYDTAKEAMVSILGELARGDSGFLQRCFQYPDNRGRKRCRIARTLEELHPHRRDLGDQHERLPGGWLVDTNINNAQKRQVVIMAATCAGLEVGTDLVVPVLDIGNTRND